MPIALLSVSDKTGLLPLARGLARLGWKLLATGGTLKVLREGGLEVQEVADFTGFPECFEGRVKTLHPRIHGGLLFRREEVEHVERAAELGIEAIDLVVVNLYPFEATVARPGVRFDEAVEQIDIGGPSMLRSAAKNHASVTVLSDPSQYEDFLAKQETGRWTLEDRKRCALEAYRRTLAFDGAVVAYLEGQLEAREDGLPPSLHLDLRIHQALRYGENPHQKAAVLLPSGSRTGLAACEQLQGKELSYNNFLDADAALRLCRSFQAPGCVIVKHNNPCGATRGASPLEAFQRALASDPISAFGGIVAFNREVGADLAEAMLPTFWEVILAPSFTTEALQCFAAKKALRLLRLPETWPQTEWDLRSIAGGYLWQHMDEDFAPFDQWELKVQGSGDAPRPEDLVLAQKVAKAVKSNAIVLVKEGATVGVGAGQMSRVDSVEIACRKAGEKAQGAVLGSDAFFPFADGLELAARHGVRAFVEPGGSVRDEEVMAAAQKLGVWLYFTGMRHFRH